MTDITSNGAKSTAGLVEFLCAPFTAMGRWMVQIGEANQRVKYAEYLQSLSDAELESRGLKRQDIVRHVFRDWMYL